MVGGVPHAPFYGVVVAVLLDVFFPFLYPAQLTWGLVSRTGNQGGSRPLLPRTMGLVHMRCKGHEDPTVLLWKHQKRGECGILKGKKKQ